MLPSITGSPVRVEALMSELKEVLVSMFKDGDKLESITTRITTGDWSIDEIILAGTSILNAAYREAGRQKDCPYCSEEDFQTHAAEMLAVVMSRSSVLAVN